MDKEIKTILCVDDDPDILESLRLILESDGYQVFTAPTGEDGVLLYKQQQPDLIIVDLMMEEVDAGNIFVKELKAMGCSCPIYMLTSMGDHYSASIDYTELGLSGVLQKPVSPETLLALIKSQ